MRGRKPIPKEMAALKAGGQPPAFTVTGEPPACPEWLDPDAHTMWGRLAPELHRLGLLSSITLEAFAGYCQCWSQWKAATEKVRAEGLCILTGKGMHRVHPAAAYAAEMARQLRSYASEFGLTPASRTRANVPAPNEERDELDQFLSA